MTARKGLARFIVSLEERAALLIDDRMRIADYLLASGAEVNGVLHDMAIDRLLDQDRAANNGGGW